MRMSATLDDKLERTFTEQLAEFEAQLKDQDDNAALLTEIHAAITDLLAENGGRDEEIREILQKRYNGGKLRLETYQLVRNVLDRVVIESMPTMPDAADDEGEDAYVRTTVIETAPPADESPHGRLQVGSVLRDRFLLQERVAGGSMGVVFKALDRRIAEADGIDPWVAIKVISPKLSKNAHALRALQQEAAKGRCLSHPNIVRFIDLDRDDDIYFIVMEWLEGRSLAAILDDNRHQSVDRATALDIVRQVGHALDYAHRCGVVHADVKPANIMIQPSGQVKLFDFGIARIRQKQLPTRREFDPGVLGAVTPAYSSMQVLTGEDPQPSDDVFSLGCLMYRLVAGHRVFGPRNAAEAAEQGMEPQRPHGLSDTQWRALKKALAYARVARYGSVAEFLDALDADAEADQVPTFTPPPPAAMRSHEPFIVEPKRAPAKRGRGWGLSLVLFVVLAGVVTVALRPDLVATVRARLAAMSGPAATGPEGETAAADENPMDGNPYARPETPAPEEEPAAAGSDAGNSAASAAAAAQQEPPPTITPAPGSGASEGIVAGGNDITRPYPDAADAGGAPGGQEAEGDAAATAGAEQGNSATEATGAEAGPAGGSEGTSADGAPASTTEGTSADAVPATLSVPIDGPQAPRDFGLVLREDAAPAVIDLVRTEDLPEALAVLIEEVGFSGNRSPLTSGRYQVSSHMARFEPGQTRARFTITMSSNATREADREARLLIRNSANSTSRFALLNLTLEDDDQRAFEANLGADTIGFSQHELLVNEQSPAVQIDVLRFNPGDSELEVRYRIAGGSATEGEDYFLPGATGLVFGPRQRTARLLIPIVQDSLVEGDETFTLELVTLPSGQPEVNREVTVIIGDDDSPF